MSWNILLYILHFTQFLRHCLHYIQNFSFSLLRNTAPVDSTELPIPHLNPTSLYSSVASKAELSRIEERHPLHPTIRQWRTPIDLRKNTPVEALYEISVSPQVTLTGPLLRQGVIMQQKGVRFYLREELGRRPENQYQITTVAVDLGTDRTYLIHIPISLFDLSSVVEHIPEVSPDEVDFIV